MDGVDHLMEDGVEHLACVLRIPVGDKLCRAFDVSEQHGHLLPLVFEGGQRANLLGKVLGGVGFG
jgi:hypothetical protein